MTTNKCPHCNQEHPAESQFCPITGKAIPESQFCMYCGESVKLDWVACPNCGKPLGETIQRTINWKLLFWGIPIVAVVIIMFYQGYITINSGSIPEEQSDNISNPGLEYLWHIETKPRDGEFIHANEFASYQGNIYFIDPETCQVHVFDHNGTFIRRWGNCGDEDGEFIQPIGIDIDNEGRVYVSDGQRYNVQVFNNDGSFITSFDNPNHPTDIGIGEDGSIFVIESGGTKVSKYSNNGEPIIEWGGEGNEDGYSSIHTSRLSSIDIDSEGYIYVTDRGNHRILKFTQEGDFIDQWGKEGSNLGELNNPLDLTISSEDEIFVLDGENFRIQAFLPDGTFIKSLHSEDSNADQLEGNFNYVSSIEILENNQIVTDGLGAIVQLFSMDGEYSHSFGNEPFSAPGDFDHPSGVAIGPNGDVYVSNSGQDSIAHFSADGALIDTWFLDDPHLKLRGIDTDKYGNIYVFDSGMRTILKISPDGQLINRWGGIQKTGTTGEVVSGIFIADCTDLHDLAISLDRVYVADTCSDGIQVFDLDGNFIEKLSIGVNVNHFAAPVAIDVDDAGNLYIAKNSGISVFSASGEFIREFSGQGQLFLTIDVSPTGIIHVGGFRGEYLAFTSEGELLNQWKDEETVLSNFPGIASGRDGSIYFVKDQGLYKYKMNYHREDN